MIRKFLLGITTLVYMAVVSGIALEIHYCMGKKAGMEFYGSSSDRCGRCGMTEKETGCCHDEHKFIKLEDSHKNVTNNISFEPAVKYIRTGFPEYEVPRATAIPVLPANSHSPPGYLPPDARLLFGVFRL